MRIAILVTHLLGTGHLKRASLLADGFVRAGHEAIVLSGGFPAPNASPDLATLIQLSPVRSDAGFSKLYGEDGEAGPALFGQRRIEIGESLAGFAPDMLITELFPFGRRKLAAEFEAAIEAAGDALVYSSVRDILQYPRKPGRAAEAEDRFARLFDGAFVHGDDALVPLEESWDLPPDLREKLHYTGYISEAKAAAAGGGTDGAGEIIVAAGGGPVGDRLFRAAAETGDGSWRLLVGGHDREERIARLKDAGSATTIEATRPDFRVLLGNARLAILQCGYNTAMDVIETGVRAVFVPFEGDGETEQITRARAFAARFGSGLVREADLSPQALAEAAGRIEGTPQPEFQGIRRDGVARTIALAGAALKERA